MSATTKWDPASGRTAHSPLLAHYSTLHTHPHRLSAVSLAWLVGLHHGHHQLVQLLPAVLHPLPRPTLVRCFPQGALGTEVVPSAFDGGILSWSCQSFRVKQHSQRTPFCIIPRCRHNMNAMYRTPLGEHPQAQGCRSGGNDCSLKFISMRWAHIAADRLPLASSTSWRLYRLCKCVLSPGRSRPAAYSTSGADDILPTAPALI